MRIKHIKIAGQEKLITIDKFNELVEKKIPFEDLGNKEI